MVFFGCQLESSPTYLGNFLVTDMFFGEDARVGDKSFACLVDLLVAKYIGLHVLSLFFKGFAFGLLCSFNLMGKHSFEGFEKRLVTDLKVECVNSFLIKLRFILFVVVAKHKSIAQKRDI